MKELIIFCVFVLPVIFVYWYTNHEEMKWLNGMISKWRREEREARKKAEAEKEGRKDEDI